MIEGCRNLRVRDRPGKVEATGEAESLDARHEFAELGAAAHDAEPYGRDGMNDAWRIGAPNGLASASRS